MVDNFDLNLNLAVKTDEDFVVEIKNTRKPQFFRGDSIMEKSVVPIVFAANDNYAIYCYTAIYSLIKNAGKEYFYHIYVFQTNISENNCRMLESLSTENIKVECVNISKYTANVNLKESIHLSVETYYRLFIPCILPQYTKILYLDSDMCILADVAKLYECNLNGYAIGAAQDIPCESLNVHSKCLGNIDCKKVFNAGVLVIDTLKFEEKKIREKCLTLLEYDYHKKERKLIFADQDALNIVLYENYFILDKRWNYQSQYLWRVQDVFEEFRQEYIEDQNKAFIVHFAGDRKPWKYPDLPQANVFWHYAKEIPEFKKMISCIMAEVRECEERFKCFENFQFPYKQIPYQSKVIIYAAGTVGKAFYGQLETSKYADLVLWVDQNWEKVDNRLGVTCIEKIWDTEYDYLIIAVDSEKIANKIKENLLQMNIPQNKIVWEEYRKK